MKEKSLEWFLKVKAISLTISVISILLLFFCFKAAMISFLISLCTYVISGRYALRLVWDKERTWWEDNLNIKFVNSLQLTTLIATIVICGFGSIYSEIDIKWGWSAIGFIFLLMCRSFGKESLAVARNAKQTAEPDGENKYSNTVRDQVLFDRGDGIYLAK